MKVITLTAPLNAHGEGAPSEFTLLKAGMNAYEGGELLFDAEAAQSVMARYQKRGIQLMADYEHQSLNPTLTGPIPAAAKKWAPEVRNGDLVAASIAWTPKAKQMLADGEYRYFSIACRVDPKSSRVTEIINFALTNNPAANGIAPLVAASLTFPGNEPATENTMKTVTMALGLNADANEAEALAVIASLKDFERSVLALSGKPARGEALGVLTALAARAERADKVEGELVALKAAQAKAEIDGLLDAAIKDGRLAPAKRDAMIELAEKAGVDGLRICLSMLPVVAQSAGESPVEEKGADAAAFTDLEVKMAKAFVGDDKLAIAKRIEEVRALNAVHINVSSAK